VLKNKHPKNLDCKQIHHMMKQSIIIKKNMHSFGLLGIANIQNKQTKSLTHLSKTMGCNFDIKFNLS